MSIPTVRSAVVPLAILSSRKFQLLKLRASLPKITVTDTDNITRTSLHASTRQEVRTLQQDYDENDRLLHGCDRTFGDRHTRSKMRLRSLIWEEELETLKAILEKEERKFHERKRKEEKDARRKAWVKKTWEGILQR